MEKKGEANVDILPAFSVNTSDPKTERAFQIRA